MDFTNLLFNKYIRIKISGFIELLEIEMFLTLKLHTHAQFNCLN